MLEVVFCTNNDHKIKEVSQIMGAQFSFLKLKDVQFFDDIPEPFETLEENSLEKAQVVHNFCGKNCFAEDTGLFVEAIDGEPGVYSARYAGEPTDSEKNIEKVLEKLANQTNRNAFFKTVITLILNGEVKQFEGICKGTIALQKQGTDGFGYDPIFIAEGYSKSFAEILAEEKSGISHRKKAFDKFREYLEKL
jgi:XTP/dITP diphosphohydrolase